MKTTSQFRLKKHINSIIVIVNKEPIGFDNDTITNEIALAYLNQEPIEGIHNFAAFPDNWKQLLSEAEPQPDFSEDKNPDETTQDVPPAQEAFLQAPIKTTAQTMVIPLWPYPTFVNNQHNDSTIRAGTLPVGRAIACG